MKDSAIIVNDAMVNVPLIADRFAMRVAATVIDKQGYVDTQFAEGVNDDEAYPNVVAAVLAGTYGVRNFAFSGYGPHQMLADEPVAAGGQDSGPGPYDSVLAGLGACTSMTMRMYADRKSLPLERVTVTLKHSKIHARDCEECETRDGMLDQIDRVISIEGVLDADQRKRLMEIADKCPVHRTLTSEIRIVTKAAD